MLLGMGPRVRTFDLRSSLDMNFRQRGRTRLLQANAVTPQRKTQLANSLDVEVFMVAGGGGGGATTTALTQTGGGGGGAGTVAVFTDTWDLTTVTGGSDAPDDFGMNIIIGDGGASATTTAGSYGATGGATTIEDFNGAAFTYIISGGGGGGSTGVAGRVGGSGGGGGGFNASRAGAAAGTLGNTCCPPDYDGMTGTNASQGGANKTTTPYKGGGGGGAGGAGATGTAGGAGGAGYTYWGQTYGKGGSSRAAGEAAFDGTRNTGNGGDGAPLDLNPVRGGSGGSGIVIISYAGSPVARYGNADGYNYGEMYTSAGRTFHVFRSVGRFFMGNMVI